ncbi:surface antigen -like protein, partial [Chrysochromulina tobinii]
ELIGASEDAWILEDPEWVAGVEGGRDGLGWVLTADKEGRVCGLNLRGKWKGEALPASVARLTALRELKMGYCKSLKSVADLPASVTKIGRSAFDGCTSLASITLPASVTQIGKGAFSSCNSLSFITIPSSTVVEPGAFSKHTQVTRA